MRVLALLLWPLFAFGQVDYLFVGFDAGETSAFTKVIKNWPKDKPYAFLAMGTSQKLVKDNIIPVDCPATDRHYTLPDLDKIAEIKPHVVISGMYSKQQADVCETFYKQGAKIIFFWDNFSTYPSLPSDLTAHVEKMCKIATRVLVPTQEIADDLNTRFSMSKALAVGQPTLDPWAEQIKSIDTKSLSFKPQQPLITYLGGYEDTGNHYDESFRLFVESLKGLQDDCELLVQLHPRSIPNFEKSVLDAATDIPKYTISTLNTYEAVALGDIIACQRTNLGINATYVGKNVLYVDVPDTIFKPFTLKNGAATQLSNPDEIQSFIKSHLNSEPIETDFGIPKDAINNILKTIFG